jgi:hypothetical protein
MAVLAISHDVPRSVPSLLAEPIRTEFCDANCSRASKPCLQPATSNQQPATNNANHQWIAANRLQRATYAMNESEMRSEL